MDKRSRDWLNIAGWIATTAVAAGATSLAIYKREYWHEMGLNEWGDFFAGMAAPAAFLWLVLGYYLQRQELRQNTRALKMQEQELHNQVEETQKLVFATVEMANAASEQARVTQAMFQENRVRASPRFWFIRTEVREDQLHPRTKVSFCNHGGTVTVESMDATGGLDLNQAYPSRPLPA